MTRRSLYRYVISICLAAALLATVCQPAYSYTLIGTSWPHTKPGDPVYITYSYSNLLDGAMGIPATDLRAAVEEGLGLWAVCAAAFHRSA